MYTTFVKKIGSAFSTFSLPKVLLLIVIVVSIVSHGYNMFHYPYFENDEGAYMSQAWSIVTQGKLAPYTYWYDHAPAGWMFIALWTTITGGFFRFGLSVESGRVFMLVIHVLSALLIFGIGKRLTRQPWVGFFAALLFSLSPFAITFQRRVLLDNIMSFWMLLSWWALLVRPLTLRSVFLSAVTFGIAVLTKENAIFFAPVFIYGIYHWTERQYRSFSLAGFIGISCMVMSLYVLFALYKGEFFPPKPGEYQHVSLLGSAGSQVGRGSGLLFFMPGSDFRAAYDEWIKKDALLIYLTGMAIVSGLLLSIKYAYFRMPSFFAVVFVLFLIRGGIVIDFYLLPLVPIAAILIAMVVDYLAYMISRGKIFWYIGLNTLVVSIFAVHTLTNTIGQYTKDETSSQVKAINWIYENVSHASLIATDGFAMVDLWEKGFRRAHWFWKLWTDPEINQQIGNDWENIDYLLVSHEMLRTMESRLGSEDILRDAFLNSTKVMMFDPSIGTYLDFSKFKSTNGDWAAIYKVVPPKKTDLATAWRTYKERFMKEYGMIFDPLAQHTTSEGQAYAMIRAVYMEDKAGFDGIWAWTKHHLQSRTNDSLLSWQWKNNTITDSGVATDADADIILALLFASQTWGDQTYKTEAIRMLSDLWKLTIVETEKYFVFTSSALSSRPDGYLVNPSYFSPAHFRVFALVDPSHDWNKVADDTYKVLAAIHTSEVYGTPTRLVPDWVLVTSAGEIVDASKYVVGTDASKHGFDGFRIDFRVAMDALWFSSNDALSYLSYLKDVYNTIYKRDGEFSSIYSTDGTSLTIYPDIATKVGPYITYYVTDSSRAVAVYEKYIRKSFNSPYGVWGDGTNYYDQNWAWFAFAMQSGAFVNVHARGH